MFSKSKSTVKEKIVSFRPTDDICRRLESLKDQGLNVSEYICNALDAYTETYQEEVYYYPCKPDGGTWKLVNGLLLHELKDMIAMMKEHGFRVRKLSVGAVDYYVIAASLEQVTMDVSIFFDNKSGGLVRTNVPFPKLEYNPESRVIRKTYYNR